MRRKKHTLLGRLRQVLGRRHRRGESGQSAVEYMLAITFLAMIVYAAFVFGLGIKGDLRQSAPGQAFEGYRRTVEAPFP